MHSKEEDTECRKLRRGSRVNIGDIREDQMAAAQRHMTVTLANAFSRTTYQLLSGQQCGWHESLLRIPSASQHCIKSQAPALHVRQSGGLYCAPVYGEEIRAVVMSWSTAEQVKCQSRDLSGQPR